MHPHGLAAMMPDRQSYLSGSRGADAGQPSAAPVGNPQAHAESALRARDGGAPGPIPSAVSSWPSPEATTPLVPIVCASPTTSLRRGATPQRQNCRMAAADTRANTSTPTTPNSSNPARASPRHAAASSGGSGYACVHHLHCTWSACVARPPRWTCRGEHLNVIVLATTHAVEL